ncbi:hypothetical protein [Neptunomonas japonica]|uniref:hypothetical protein n=1 Tax=Neptunomonas japonica TaxID=417574 RepID=UPI0003FBC23E|nr:hypothetical protein [Neptunomonas japonica]
MSKRELKGFNITASAADFNKSIKAVACAFQALKASMEVEILPVSDGRQRCKAPGHSTRLATHYTEHGHFCPECVHRIKHQHQYGGPAIIREIQH